MKVSATSWSSLPFTWPLMLPMLTIAFIMASTLTHVKGS